jgi:putative tryptophan/tyrosine transport system substrate-binding protein
MTRRAFIAALDGAAAWPLAVHAQQGERKKRIGVLIARSESDPEGRRAIPIGTAIAPGTIRAA